MIHLPLPLLVACSGVLAVVVIAAIVVALLPERPEKPGRRRDDPEEK